VPKKHDFGNHSCFALPSCDEQVIVRRKVVLIDFFGNLHRRFLIKSPCCAPPPTLKPDNCDGWLFHAPGATTLKVSSGDEIATPLASAQLGTIITCFPRGLRNLQNPPQHLSPAANLFPDPPS